MTSMAMLEDIVAQIGVSMKELAEQQKRTDRALEGLAEEHKKTERSLESLAEERKNTERSVELLTKSVDRVTKNMGGLNNSVGEIVEIIIIPGVKEKMNAYKHNFTMASPGKEYSDVDGSTLTEVDLLLENCDEVMVVEVKTQVSVKWVNKHLNRLALLRKKERITGMTGKTIYAAVAGISFDDEARALAVENGMYLIEIEEDNERINIIPPVNVGTW